MHFVPFCFSTKLIRRLLMKKYLLFFTLTLFVSCSPVETAEESFSFTSGDPDTNGFHSDSLAVVTTFLEDAVENKWIPGAVALIVKDGAILYEEAVGFSDIESNRPVATDDIFRLASMTKAITSAAVLMLADQNLLHIDDPVSAYIPEFSDPMVIEAVDFSDTTWTSEPADREITIHHLLTHTSGISYGFTDSTMSAIYTKNSIPDGLVADNIEIGKTMPALGKLPLKHNPGEMWTYGLSTDILGRVVEVVSGKPLDQFFRSEIFEPLGMDDTAFYLPQEKADRLVPLYMNPDRNVLEKVTETGMGDSGPVSPQELFVGKGTYFSGGAGLTGTARDYQRFMQMVLNHGELGGLRLMSEETARLMHDHQIGDLRVGTNGFSYGFQVTLEDGSQNNGREAGSLGWGGIFQTTYWMNPEENISVVLMTQVFPSRHQQELYSGFEKRVQGSVFK